MTLAGQHYRVTDHAISPIPVQKPHPPIFIGGNGPQLLSLAAHEADIVGLSGITFRQGGAAPSDLSSWRASGVDERIELLRRVVGAERYARLEINAMVQRVIVTDDRHKAARELISRWPDLTPDTIFETPYVLIGTVEEIVSDLETYRQKWDISYYTIREPDMDTFSPVVARLASA